MFIDYQSYYARLASLISQAGKNDEIFLAGWSFRLDEFLTDKTALEFLEIARGRGARVRLLSTPTHSWGPNASQMAEAAKKNIEAKVDAQLPSGTSFHQKSALIKLENSTHLFLGGMDVTTGRVDEWFDVQAEIIGVGADLGRKTLEERWESVNPPLGGASFSQRSLPTGKGDAHQVQFVRTYPPFPQDTTGWQRSYATAGDHTYYSLICRAIASAKTSIYIEDQFFITMGKAPTRTNPAGGSSPRVRSDLPDLPDTFDRLLQDALGRGVRLVVITANKKGPLPHHDPAGRDTLVRSLKHATNPPTLLHMLPDTAEIPGYPGPYWPKFVHSKTWIFDDEFVVIGSGNYWPNSFVSVTSPAEGEFGVGFTSKVDGTSIGFPKATFARALRIRLWERLMRHWNPSFMFTRDASASFEDEVKELIKPWGTFALFEQLT